MKRTLAYASLLFLSLLTGCPRRQTGPAQDYDSTRQRSEQSHQSLDQQKEPQGE